MVKSFAHGAGVPRLENDVPEAIGQAVSLLHASGAVMVKVVPLDIAEVRTSKIIKVDRVVDPFLDHIALHNTCQQDWKGVDRSKQADRRRNKE